jgi:hypothetical protein
MMTVALFEDFLSSTTATLFQLLPCEYKSEFSVIFKKAVFVSVVEVFENGAPALSQISTTSLFSAARFIFRIW